MRPCAVSSPRIMRFIPGREAPKEHSWRRSSPSREVAREFFRFAQMMESAIRRNTIFVVFMTLDQTFLCRPFQLAAEASAWREKFWQKHSLGRRLVLVIAPGSGDRAKNWPERYFSAVAGWWRDQMKGVVIVLVGPVEEERGGFTELSAYGPTVGNLELARSGGIARRQLSLSR